MILQTTIWLRLLVAKIGTTTRNAEKNTSVGWAQGHLFVSLMKMITKRVTVSSNWGIVNYSASQ